MISVSPIANAVANRLNTSRGWIVSGSAAMAWHGLPVEPNDIDIWCLPSRLGEFAARCDCCVETYDAGTHSLERFVFHELGWEIEVAGKVELAKGFCMQVDEAMLSDSASAPPVESIEDLSAELLALRRPCPKNDVARAKALFRLAPVEFQISRCRARLSVFGMSTETIDSYIAELTE